MNEYSLAKVQLLKQLFDNRIITSNVFEYLNKLAIKNCRQPNSIIFLDTETNGLPKKYAFNLTDQPRLVQLSWIVVDEDGRFLKECDYLIKPTDFDISDDSIKIHGITKEMAMKEGSNIRDVLDLFMDDIRSCNAIVGHNVQFDLMVLRGELERQKIKNYINKMPTYCTMNLSVDYCKLPIEALNKNQAGYSLKRSRENQYKYPKLIELYEFLFEKKFNNSHDSYNDVYATLKCYFELVKRKVITYVPTNRTYKDIIQSLKVENKLLG